MRQLICLIVVLLAAGPARADFIVDLVPVGAPLVTTGGTLAYDVKLSLSAGSPSFDLQTFSMYFDLHRVGEDSTTSLPSGLGTITVSNYLTDFGTAGTNPGYQLAADIRNLGNRPTFDFEVNAEKNTGALPVPTTPTSLTLFRLTINSGTLTTGGYELTFVSDPSYLDPGDNVNSLSIPPLTGTGDPGDFSQLLSSETATFAVAAVPEPSSALLLVCAACGGAALRRRTPAAGANTTQAS